jgi:ribosome maturation factor RimP
MDAEALVGPVVEAAGLELVEVKLARGSGRQVLRVIVDRDGGVDVDAIAEVAEAVSRRLDLEGYDAGPYSLEVSSPGIERVLKRPRDFERQVGAMVKLKMTQDRPALEGTLVSADDGGIVLAAGDGELHVRYGDIATARTVVDWDAELKGSAR